MSGNVFDQLLTSFKAFNKNALSSLQYVMSQNIWFVLIAVAAITAIVLMLKEELDYSVNEEQNII